MPMSVGRDQFLALSRHAEVAGWKPTHIPYWRESPDDVNPEASDNAISGNKADISRYFVTRVKPSHTLAVYMSLRCL